MKELLENMITELRGMSYEDALENLPLLEELYDQVGADITNIISNS